MGVSTEGQGINHQLKLVYVIKMVKHGRCHLTPRFFYMTTVGFIQSKF